MLNGRVVLGGLTLEFGDARGRFDDLAGKVRSLQEKHEALIDEERTTLEELARVYLPELSPAAVSAGLVELRSRLKNALEEQEKRRTELEQEVAHAGERVSAAEGPVSDLEAEEEQLARRLDEASMRVEEVLLADPDHSARAAEHEEIMERRERLKKRRARLGAVSTVERPRYETDRAFRYLQARSYGDPEYRAGFLTRRLDRWLAQRIDFETLSRNYRILRVGPHQIQAEVRRLTERAAELEGELDRREAEVAGAEGLLGLVDEQAALEARLTEARDTLERARVRENALAKELRDVEMQRGRHHEEAIALHRNFLENKTVGELESLALTTADPTDDALVRRLEDVRSRMAPLERELDLSLKELGREARRADRLAELESMGIRRFGSLRSRFPDGFEGDALIDALTEGEIAPDEAVRRFEAAHVTAPLVLEVERPYFDAMFRDLTSAFDSVLERTTDVDGEIASEYVIKDLDGNVLSRRVTRRSVGSDE